MPEAAPPPLPLSGRTIVLGVSGSISAYKAADLCSKLVQEGARVLPILTRGALEFVRPATFRGLTREPVATEGFEEPFPGEIAHLRYSQIADLFVVAPASADLLARLAVGLCDDMLTSALLANPAKPVLLAPAMNTHMWENLATQANRQTLQARGYRVIEPSVGRLAENMVGVGRLAEPVEIVQAVKDLLLARNDLAGVPVLVTAGPTREAIDPVRYITNRSSGKMGYAIAEAAAARGARVTLVTGPVSLAPPPGVADVARVTSAQEMFAACVGRAPEARVVVAVAAVADYAPEQAADQKIKKQAGGDSELTLALSPTPDILKHLGEHKMPGQVLVGFAAETQDLEANAREKLAAKRLDLIVANDVTREGAGFDADTNIVSLISSGDGGAGAVRRLPRMSKQAVADAMWDAVVKEFL